jgi:hypothetical protein
MEEKSYFVSGMRDEVRKAEKKVRMYPNEGIAFKGSSYGVGGCEVRFSSALDEENVKKFFGGIAVAIYKKI